MKSYQVFRIFPILRKIKLRFVFVGLSAALIVGCGGGGSHGGHSTAEPQVIYQGVSTNSSGAAVVSLYLAYANDEQLKRVAELGQYEVPEKRFSISPDKRHIAYWSVNVKDAPKYYSLYIADIDGGHARKIRSSTYAPEVFWSPAGDELLYCNMNELPHVYMLVSVPDGNARLLNPSGGYIDHFAWSGNGDYFVHTLRMEEDAAVWLLKHGDGSATKVLSFSDFHSLHVSDSGKFVVFNTYSEEKLLIVAVDSAQTMTIGGVFLYDFDWLPDRNSAYFINGYTRELSRLDLDTFSITPVNYPDSSPVMADATIVSPNGERLFFTTYGPVGNSLGIVRVLDDHVLFAPAISADLYPVGLAAWSPSSRRVAVALDSNSSGTPVLIINGETMEVSSVRKQDGGQSFRSFKKIAWLGEDALAVQESSPHAIQVGELAGTGLTEIGVSYNTGFYDYVFDTSSDGTKLFYLMGLPAASEGPPGDDVMPIVYDLKTNQSRVFRPATGETVFVQYFQVIK